MKNLINEIDAFLVSRAGEPPLLSHTDGVVTYSQPEATRDANPILAAGFLFGSEGKDGNISIDEKSVFDALTLFYRSINLYASNRMLEEFVRVLTRAKEEQGSAEHALLLDGIILRKAHERIERKLDVRFKYHYKHTTLLLDDEPLTVDFLKRRHEHLCDKTFEVIANGGDCSQIMTELDKNEYLHKMFAGDVGFKTRLGEETAECHIYFNPFAHLVDNSNMSDYYWSSERSLRSALNLRSTVSNHKDYF